MTSTLNSDSPAPALRPDGTPCRPKNSFMFFRLHFLRKQQANGTGCNSQNNVSKAASAAWASISEEEKAVYVKMADEEAARLKVWYPDYQYRPVRKPKSKVTRRAHKQKPGPVEKRARRAEIKEGAQVLYRVWGHDPNNLPEYFSTLPPGDLVIIEHDDESDSEDESMSDESSEMAYDGPEPGPRSLGPSDWPEAGPSSLGPSDWPAYN